AGADGFHHRHRPIGRHADRALAADAVDRNHAGPVVLVAAGRLPPRRLSIPETAAATSAEGRPGPGHSGAARAGVSEIRCGCPRLRTATSRGLARRRSHSTLVE